MFKVGDKLVCTAYLPGHDPQPFYGQPVTIVNVDTPYDGSVVLIFDDPTGPHSSRSNEHMFHSSHLVTSEEFALIQATKGI